MNRLKLMGNGIIGTTEFFLTGPFPALPIRGLSKGDPKSEKNSLTIFLFSLLMILEHLIIHYEALTRAQIHRSLPPPHLFSPTPLLSFVPSLD